MSACKDSWIKQKYQIPFQQAEKKFSIFLRPHLECGHVFESRGKIVEAGKLDRGNCIGPGRNEDEFEAGSGGKSGSAQLSCLNNHLFPH